MPGHPHSADIKAEAMAALLAGATVASVARQFHVSRNTVRVWRAQATDYAALSPREKEAIGELIGKYLRAGLRLLEAQAVFTNDQDYIRGQDADKLAILHGVVADKLVRILAGLEAGSSDIE